MDLGIHGPQRSPDTHLMHSAPYGYILADWLVDFNARLHILTSFSPEIPSPFTFPIQQATI